MRKIGNFPRGYQMPTSHANPKATAIPIRSVRSVIMKNLMPRFIPPDCKNINGEQGVSLSRRLLFKRVNVPGLNSTIEVNQHVLGWMIAAREMLGDGALQMLAHVGFKPPIPGALPNIRYWFSFNHHHTLGPKDRQLVAPSVRAG